MKLDFATSTVTIADRWFPAVAVICPPHGSDNPGTDRERMLGGHEGPGTIIKTCTDQVYIPCENGAFVAVEQNRGEPGYTVTLHSRACQEAPWDDDHLWVPYFVAIYGGMLVATDILHRMAPRAPWRWTEADPEWTVELIDRINRMPFTQPPGPQVRLIPLGEAFDRV